MNTVQTLSISARHNLYLNLLNVGVFLIIAFTGSLLQVEFHMHRLPEGYPVMGLDRPGWVLLHRASAITFLAGIGAHCSLNRRFISASTRRLLNRKPRLSASPSYWLFIICIPACLTGMASWMLFGAEGPAMFLLEDPARLLLVQGHANHGWILARFLLIESHDKLGWPLIILSIIHIVSRAGRMTRAYRRRHNA